MVGRDAAARRSDPKAVSDCCGPRVWLVGWCEADAATLARSYHMRGAAGLAGWRGEYVAIAEAGDECVIVSSLYGVCNYYYVVHAGRLYHGDTVLEVLRESGLAWQWNWRAVADGLLVDHPVDNETLHPLVRRVPHAAVLRWAGGELTVSCRRWEDLHPRAAFSPDETVAAFNAAVERQAAPDAMVSISAGLDSRLILSAFARLGKRPDLLVMGFADSTDVVAAGRLAEALGLRLLTVELRPEDYVEHGLTISRLTNGCKIADCWHTYIYPARADLNGSRQLFVGANGEFARSFYVKSEVAGVLGQMAPSAALEALWRAKLNKRLTAVFGPDELHYLHPDLARELTSDAMRDRARRMADLCGREWPRGLDRFYLEQRVRNFIGAGMKLYEAHCSPRSPFLDADWVRATWWMERRWKAGSRWHHHAIEQNYSGLGTTAQAGARPSAPCVPYARYDAWFHDGPIAEFIHENADVIADVMDGGLVRALLLQKDHPRRRALAFVLQQIFWRANLRDIGRAGS